MDKKTLKWRNSGRNSVLTISKRAYISFNPNPGGDPIGSMFQMMGTMTAGIRDGNGAETALVLEPKEKDGKRTFLILNGDWRESFKEAAKKGGLKACRKLYDSLKKEYQSEWSTDRL